MKSKSALQDAKQSVKAAKQQVKLLKAQLKAARAAVKTAKSVRAQAEEAALKVVTPETPKKAVSNPGNPTAVRGQKMKPAKVRLAATSSLRPLPAKRRSPAPAAATEVVQSLPADIDPLLPVDAP